LIDEMMRLKIQVTARENLGMFWHVQLQMNRAPTIYGATVTVPHIYAEELVYWNEKLAYTY
jgi:hypothetical protein